jgi:hypothetical protein
VDPLTLTVVGVAAAVAGLRGFIYWYATPQVIKRALSAHRRVPITEAGVGRRAKIVGRVGAVAEPLVAPISGRPCVHWQVWIESKQPSGKGTFWREVLHTGTAQDFFLSDETGRAIVSPGESWTFAAVRSRSGETSGRGGRTDHAIEALLHASERARPSGSEGLRCFEAVYEIGQEIAVVGLASLEPDPDPTTEARGNYREPPKRLRLGPAAKRTVIASDDPNTFR